jgi:hypothetical protein
VGNRAEVELERKEARRKDARLRMSNPETNDMLGAILVVLGISWFARAEKSRIVIVKLRI